jgi:non-specific protein-tyrosine kinase
VNAVELREYLRILRLRWRLIAACALVCLAASAGATLSQTPVYQATTQLFVSATNDPSVSTAYTGSLFTQQRVKSYKQFVSSPTVGQAIKDDLHLTLPAGTIGAKISADAPVDTVLLNIHVRDADPVLAQRIANSAGVQFSKLIDTIERPDLPAGTPAGQSPVKVTTVRAASLPQTPVEPRTKLNLALGLLVGLAAGVGLAVLRDVLDTRVKNPEVIEEKFHLPTLTVVGFDPSAKASPLITSDRKQAQRAEAFRRLRTNLQFVDVDRRPRSIVVTSAVPGEGKTTTACNLAIALAEAGIDVVLIDGDLRRPSLGEYLGIESAVGLTNVLIGQVDLDTALQPWGRSGHLKVLTSGILPPNPSEILGSRQMADIVQTLEGRGLVLLDAPPLLPVTDGAVLAADASGVLVVIRANSTRREQVSSALESLRAVDAHVLGCVLNMAPTRGPDAYSYGYGYYGKPPVSHREGVKAEETIAAPSVAAVAAPPPSPPPPAVVAVPEPVAEPEPEPYEPEPVPHYFDPYGTSAE